MTHSMPEFRRVLGLSPLPTFVLQQGSVAWANQKAVDFTGRTWDQLLNQPFGRLVDREDASVISAYLNCPEGRAWPESFDFRVVTRAGEKIFVRGFFHAAKFRSLPAVIVQMTDITDFKKREDEIRISEANYRSIFDAANDAIYVHDMETGNILDVNRKMLEMFGFESKEEIIFTSLDTSEEYIANQGIYNKGEICRRLKIAAGGEPQVFEWLAKHKTGRLFWVEVNLKRAVIGGADRLLAIVRDISGRKQTEEKLKYYSLHDPLTGLYNRSYFEQDLRRLEGGRHFPVGLIMCDLDGLKLINDTLGHDTGDALLVAAAKVIREPFREGDMVARIGGDEFAVLLPDTPGPVLEKACQRIRDSAERYNSSHSDLPLNISIGYAVSAGGSHKLGEIFKEADNNMYREKLNRSKTARSSIVRAMMKVLEARDFITEGHVERIKDLVAKTAAALGFPSQRLTDLLLLARFHDIGKVGIPDRILFKPGPLSCEEYAEIKGHCEIGYRIAKSVPDLEHVADWILKHHEWWDGRGYPLGLKGEKIPLECRILSIVDAYDAMTNNRPYREAMPREKAVRELERCSGSQFDPHLVPVFARVVESLGDN